ncbi:unnamed protein product [Phaedon cochleariae]|uniref:CHHC U11-48K-type domain-containing protein n=1 Tax=Phaedon cochleariae TaxID=80249 RepID=A0A9P0GSN2_PHACE|nr:unnamed protein product [Phaedon cochleariae]
MNINIEVRKKQLHSLDQYITSSKDKVESILGYLGWTAKKVKEKKDVISCPLNPRHKIHFEKINKHLESCCIRTAGYEPGDNFLSEPLHNATSSITLDNAKKIEILNGARISNMKYKQAWNGVDPDPMTSDRLMSTFSSDERLSLYDYCISNTEAPPTPSEFTVNIDELEKKADKQLTEEEKREQERNAKRRRTKYKSVHTGRNKNYSEVMRQVIDNQMDSYREYLVDKERLEKELERKRLEEVYEQFDQPDASNIIYDFDADPNSVGSNVENLYNNINYDLDYGEFGEEEHLDVSEQRPNHSCEASPQAQKERDHGRRSSGRRHSSRPRRDREKGGGGGRRRSRSRPPRGGREEGRRSRDRREARRRPERRY